MKLAVSAEPEDAAIIRELLSIWEITWVPPKDSDVAVVYRKNPVETTKKTVLIPSDSFHSESLVNHFGYTVTNTVGKPISIEVTPEVRLSFSPEVLYEIKSPDCPANEDLIISQLDFVKELKRMLRQTLAVKPSLTYRLATSLPFPYSIAPKGFRDQLMRKRGERSRLDLRDFLPIDALRFALARLIEELSGEKLCRKKWDHRPSACVLTHDIDTKEGLRKSGKVKTLEEKYDVPSAWFVPSRQYTLDHEIIRKLENNGEVGSHDTRHDGRLSSLAKKKLIERLNDGKRLLESIVGHPIEGFRAPLLQHTSKILAALLKCGFAYDTSIPTWEPKHPRTMGAHGIGTLFPISIEGITEIPITIVQDHQLLHVLGLTPKEAIEEWLLEMNVCMELGGTCVLLSHPEYGLLEGAEGLPLYEELLNTIVSDRRLQVILPKEIPEISAKQESSFEAMDLTDSSKF